MKRYLKQIIFERIGEKGQKLLSKSKVVIIGCGANGSVASELLTRSGVGHLTLIDDDKITLDNLQRQTLYKEKDVNEFKVEIAQRELNEINSRINIKIHKERLTDDNIQELIGKPDLILDCTDNMKSRVIINKYAVKEKIPWIFIAVLGSRGMTMNILPKHEYCFECFFSEADLPTADTAGIINTINNATVSFAITEALKILTKQECSKELVILDIWKQKIEKVKLKNNSNCHCSK